MAGNGFLKIDQALVEGTLDGATSDAFLIKKNIRTLLATYEGCGQVAFFVSYPITKLIDRFDALRYHERCHPAGNICQDERFLFGERRPGIALHTTAALAFRKIAYKMLIIEFIGKQTLT